MKTNRLTQTLTAALNAQMTKEAHASQIYLSYGAWASAKGFDGVANFLFRHAQEERNHMMKVLEYILRRGGEVMVDAIPAPPAHPVTLYECFESVFTHEVGNSKSINGLVKMSLLEEDWATWNFLQWFVKEQVEEETFAMNLLDKFRIAGGAKVSGETLYELDKDLGKATGEVVSAQEVTADKP
jgi:ferritin